MNKRLGRLLRPGMGLYFAMLIVFCLVAFLLHQPILAMAQAGLCVVFIAVYLLDRKERRRRLQNYAKQLVGQEAGLRNGETPFPLLLVRLGDRAIVYANDSFVSAAAFQEGVLERQIEDIIPGFQTDWLTAGKTEYPYDVTINDRRYRVYGTVVKADDPDHTLLGMLHFADLTDLYQVRDEYIRSRPVVGIILVDNFDELTRSMSESAISNMNAKINAAITSWAESFHGMLRRLEKNRYLLVFEKRDLASAKKGKFSLLEQVHEITGPAGMPATISFGMGVDGDSFEESFDFATLAIDMALSRGGDQAVIKDRYNFEFFGGSNKETEQRSKVNSRVTADSLMNLVSQSSQVFVMGHKNADLDALGAAVGVCCLCRKWGKPASIVLDIENNAAPDLLEEVRNTPEYKRAFISGEEAMLSCDSRSVLVIVDTNRPDQVEFRPLLETISQVCVIDHHRRAADYIDPVTVNFHAPYASSASELVAELLQYSVERRDVLPIEAKSLLAGIFLDTKSFHVRTGERTFEAAAYLRELGAEPVEVKKLLQNDFGETMAKYQIIKSARMYRGDHAIAALNSPTSRILAAKAADELLNISGINASFVMYPDGDTVILSARSIGKANVQVILEPLGGGGNAATAGAQIKNTTVKAVVEQLTASIDRFYEQ